MQARNPLPPYHSFGVGEQAVDALAKTVSELAKVEVDPFAWKWAIIALHNALHGFMGLALRGSHGARLLIPKHERQKYARWERERALGRPIFEVEKERVDAFLDLYAKIQDPARMRQYVHSKAFEPTADQDVSMEWLDQLRNSFSHYSAVTQIEPVAALPELVRDCVAVVAFLVDESQNVLLYPFELEARTRELLGHLQVEAARLATAYQPL